MQDFKIKKNKKVIISFFIICFLFTFSSIAINAEYYKSSKQEEAKPLLSLNFTPSVTIPGSEFKAETPMAVSKNNVSDLLARYISAIFEFFVVLSAFLAVIMIMIAGVKWMLAAGSSEKVGEARKMIGNAIIGLVLALATYTILSLINPHLVILKGLNITPIKRIESIQEALIRGEKNLAAERSGLDICEIKEKNETHPGIKLNVIDSKIKTGGDWWSKANDYVFGAVFDVILNPEADTCKAYCETGNFCNGMNCIKYVKVLKVIDEKNSVICCTCEKPIRLDRKTLAFSIMKLYKNNFDSGVSNQVNDASSELLNFLSCMHPKIQINERKISSISDNNHIGRLEECSGSDYAGQCSSNAPSNTCCYHANNSCHYGGGSPEKGSFAVDFGAGGQNRENPQINNCSKTATSGCLNSINKSIIFAAQNCGAKFINIESNHIHISVPPCAKN